jgi:subtilisin family serine protease
LDTGAHFAHEDLVGKLRDDIDWDYINGDNTAQDDHGHGTHVAGIIAATPNNSLGVVGLGWNATVVPFKILDQSGSGELSLSVPAIYAATDQGADVINMSLGTDPQNALQCGNFPELVEALRYAYERGVLVVVAAGNSKQDASNVVPANCPYVLTVAATDMDDWPANFAGEAGSNYGSVVDVAAPGKFIYAPWLDPDIPYAYLEGTSMAAPFVSALAALVWAKYPLYAPDQVAAAILDNALDLGGSGWDQDYGCGRIQAADAVITATTGSMSACRPDALAPSGKMSSSSILGQHPPDTDAYVPGRLIVGFRDQSGLGGQSAVGEQDRLALLRNLGVLNVEHRLPNGAMIVQVAEGREWAIAQQLVRENCVAYVHLDYWISAR